jgi:GNAT superfamily N-acetyltransferase
MPGFERRLRPAPHGLTEPDLRRTVGLADIAGVRALIDATGFFRPDETAVAVELVEDRLAKGLETSGYHFLFADDAAGLAGYACFGPIPCTLTSWDLYWIAVSPAAQGRGIGRRLLQATEEAVRQAGGLSIYVETSSRPQYDPTRAFYLACGYRIEHVFADFYAPGDGKTVYVKRL